jgi:hypothetical protein
LLVGNHKFYLMGVKSLIRLATGKRGRIPGGAGDSSGLPAPSPARSVRTTISDSIQTRRWRKALAEDTLSIKS